MATFLTVSTQLKLKDGKQPLEPGKTLEAGLHHGRPGDGLTVWRRLPPPADAGHVCVELAGEAAARSTFEERGPDGWLK